MNSKEEDLEEIITMYKLNLDNIQVVEVKVFQLMDLLNMLPDFKEIILFLLRTKKWVNRLLKQLLWVEVDHLKRLVNIRHLLHLLLKFNRFNLTNENIFYFTKIKANKETKKKNLIKCLKLLLYFFF